MTSSLLPAERAAPSRVWAWAGLVAQVVFVLSWLIAAAWQGPGYRVLAHSISDMYAVTAPHGAVLVWTLTVCGAAVMLFAGLSLWPALRPAGWSAALGCALLAVSIFGLGDLLSPFERLACRLADSGCSDAAQLSNLGGKLDTGLSTVGAMLFIAAGFFLAAAMQRLQTWKKYARPLQLLTILFALSFAVLGLGTSWGGLAERLLAFFGAAGIAVMAYGVLNQGESKR